MGRVDDILELIDGALGDGMSPDAVRWTPDKPAEVLCKGGVHRAGDELGGASLHDGCTFEFSASAWSWDECNPSDAVNTVWRSDAYEATLLAYGEFSNSERQAHGRSTDITEC